MEIILTKVENFKDIKEKALNEETVMVKGKCIAAYFQDGYAEKEMIEAQKFRAIEDTLTDKQEQIIEEVGI